MLPMFGVTVSATPHFSTIHVPLAEPPLRVGLPARARREHFAQQSERGRRIVVLMPCPRDDSKDQPRVAEMIERPGT
jgi:hypothetical protein